MKRILSFVLVLVMCLSLLAACGEPAETTAVPAGGSVEDAKDYLAAMYKDTDGTVARRDFTMVAAVMIECIRGEGGVLPLDYDYVQAVKKRLKGLKL